MRALVVDDSRAMRAILKRALSTHGFEVAEAPDGEAALVVLDEGSCPDLVLVDLHMPNMDGMDFVRAMRGDTKYDGVRVLVASGDCDLHRIESALSAGADEYLMKPFDSQAVLDKLVLLGLKE